MKSAILAFLFLSFSMARADTGFEKFEGNYKIKSINCYSRYDAEESYGCPEGVSFTHLEISKDIDYKGNKTVEVIERMENYDKVSSLGQNISDVNKFERFIFISDKAIWQYYVIQEYLTRWEELEVSAIENGLFSFTREYHEVSYNTPKVETRVIYTLEKL